jgi:acetyl-CoA carboxylase carboxyltransferase component
MAATVVELAVAPGDAVRAGQTIAILEAMKMEHELRAPADAVVAALRVAVGELLSEGDPVADLAPPSARPRPPAPVVAAAAAAAAPPASALRADLAEATARHAFTLDANRPEAVAKRHALGLRTARENIADLCDEDSFVEYGALAVAAQRSRRSDDDLRRNTPADGIVTGIGAVGGVRCAVLAYDATVLAGTQGLRSHQKTDRLLQVALAERLPVVLFAEGGGGRPGDTDAPVVAGLHVTTFASFARLSGLVPTIGIVAGRCFAGNAALLGCCDLIVATRGSNIGMGGPAMIEGGGLGVFRPEDIGPADVQSRNGVIDLLVADEAEAVAAARRILGCLRGARVDADASAELRLRDVLPAQRSRSYDMRAVLPLVADADSLIELRSGFGAGIHTALARIGGTPVALLASNPLHLAGAIDPDAADKASRFMQLADAHGLPIVSLVDTPGFMVGPEVETRAQVRHASRMFVAAARLRVPFVAVVLRKGYGLGAMAMTGGGFHATVATAAWPSGEFGAMGLEGAVRLGYRKELDAQPEGAARDALFERLLARQVEAGGALNMAATLEIDAVIDPGQTRCWIAQALAAARTAPAAGRFVDPW